MTPYSLAGITCLCILGARVLSANITLSVAPSADGQPEAYELVWQTEPQMLYSLQHSPDLESWETLAGYPQEGTGEEFTFPLGADDQPEFFRVTATEAPPEQLLNLPVPADGKRYHSYDEFDGPRWPSSYGEGHVTLWHEGKFAAYSITIDDNNAPDFPFWLEVAEDYGWKLTWFVIVHPYIWDIYEDEPGTHVDSYFGSLEAFAELSDLGHDIQLHGACDQMNALSAADYEDHILRSIAVLEAATGKPILTYAYPCGELTSEDGQDDYRAIIGKYLIAARGTSGGITPVHLLDYLNTRSLGVNALVDGQPSKTFARTHDRRNFDYSQYRGWAVTLYHGLGAAEEREAAITRTLATLDYVKAHEDQYWVAPFTDVAKYAQERESATLRILTVEPNRIEFTVSDRMDDTIFDHPLTVKLRLDDGWTSITATQDGEPITATLIQHEGATYAMVEPIPDRGHVILTPSN